MSIANLKKNGAMDVKDRIYVDILTKIMTGDFGPKYRLTEDSLAKQFHVSRTPVREVLVALEKDGLIHREPNRGATVVAFTPEDVEDIYEIRNALECCAIRRGVRGIKMSKLLDLKRELEQASQESGPSMCRKQEEIDLRLHDTIIKASANRRLISYLENISLLCRSLTLASYLDGDFAQHVGRQHLAIVEALIRRDELESERLLREHIIEGRRNALDVFQRRNSQQSDHAKPSCIRPEPRNNKLRPVKK